MAVSVAGGGSAIQLQYLFDVAAEGSYAITLRVAAPSQEGTIEVAFNGVAISEQPLVVRTTEAPDAYVSLIARDVFLTEGLQEMTVTISPGVLLSQIGIGLNDVAAICIPAVIYWGGINMDRLGARDAGWGFVQLNADGFLFHAAWWS